MMSFALMGCLIFGASDASAQGRSRSQGGSTSSRSQSAAVSRSNSATAPTVSHNSSSSNVSRSSATPQVNRSSSSSSSVSRSASTPQVNRSSSSSSSVNRTTSSSSSVSRSTTGRNTSGSSTSMNRGATTRGGNDKVSVTGTSTTTRRSDSGMAGTLDKTTKTDRTSSVVGTSTTDRISGNRPGGTKPNGDNGGNGKPNGGNGGHDKPNGGNGGHDKPNGGNGGHDKPNGGNGGHDKPNGGNGGHDRPNGGHGKPNGYDNHNHFDYGNHHYGNDFRRNYTNHSWSWSRPLPPPARPYRPLYRTWYRPVIPAGWYPYAGAPIIDRILGITFGTLFDTSIEYLYYNGYEIDGYADHILYLRNVPLLNLTWDDVMLCYDSRDRLVNAQFVFMSSHNNNYRYERVYRNLCRVYGTPFSNSDGVLNWYGGNNTGWITLSTHTNLGYYYTTLSIGY